MLERVVPWWSVTGDNLQYGSEKLMIVCKGFEVQKSLGTLRSRREWGESRWCGSYRRQRERGGEINIFDLKQISTIKNYKIFSQIKGNSVNIICR